MSTIWWEKTVEYLFVIQHIKQSIFIAPLDGNQEKAGDVIFSKDKKWILIEFKRNEETISTEINKFENYKVAKIELEPFSYHHTIIYGALENDNLALKAKGYFSGLKLTIEQALAAGVDHEPFTQYVVKLIAYKNSKNGGGSGNTRFSLVAGVTENGKIKECMTMAEYSRAISNQFNQRYDATRIQENDSPSPGM